MKDFHTTVRLVPWTPEWRRRFETEKAQMEEAFSRASLPVQIHHTGSTSIQGMWSKPIIDVLVIAQDKSDLFDYEDVLIHLGYSSLGECGRQDRVFLTRGDTETDAFYVHLTYADNPVARDQLLFQYIERAVPDIARAYMMFKSHVADEHANDRRGYTAAKAPFIESVLAAYRLGAMKLEHRGMRGSIEYSEEDGLFYGKIQDTKDLILYQGEDIVALNVDFRDAVDDYLDAFADDDRIDDRNDDRSDEKTDNKSDDKN